jgi:hypothetical protein
MCGLNSRGCERGGCARQSTEHHVPRQRDESSKKLKPFQKVSHEQQSKRARMGCCQESGGTICQWL